MAIVLEGIKLHEHLIDSSVALGVFLKRRLCVPEILVLNKLQLDLKTTCSYLFESHLRRDFVF